MTDYIWSQIEYVYNRYWFLW